MDELEKLLFYIGFEKTNHKSDNIFVLFEFKYGDNFYKIIVFNYDLIMLYKNNLLDKFTSITELEKFLYKEFIYILRKKKINRLLPMNSI